MLTGAQLSRITAALLDAYSRDELRQVILAGIDVDFTHHVSPEKPYAAQVFEFVDWTNRQGLAISLLVCAYNQNSRNSAMQELVQQTSAWPEGASAGLTVFAGQAYVYAIRDVEEDYLTGLLKKYRTYNALPAMIGWIPYGKRGPREDKAADEALYAEQQAHMADAVEKLRRLALGE